MTDVQDVHAQLRAINQSAAFNRWCGLEVKSASPGQVELVMPWRAEFGQYGGFLHAGLIGALIDTACGFAAVTVAGSGVLAAHFSVNCLRPAQGEHSSRGRESSERARLRSSRPANSSVSCRKKKGGRHRRNVAERQQGRGLALQPGEANHCIRTTTLPLARPRARYSSASLACSNGNTLSITGRMRSVSRSLPISRELIAVGVRKQE